MNEESLEKIRQQFDAAPYPRVALETSPKGNLNQLFTHSLVAPYYLCHGRVIDSKDRLILDAGCGSGYKALMLAEANPGAKIVGIDLSEESVNLSQQRLQYHGFENVEFHTMLIEELPTLGLEFDYINCDEVLYLMPDPVAGLQAMKSVLKPDGILRSNLHNVYQRQSFYQAQTLFGMMGLMDENPREMEIEIVQETMRSLKDDVKLKMRSWNNIYEQQPEGVLVDHLLVGDKGFTIPDLFNLLQAADLELVSLLNWQHWKLADLFQDANGLPEFWRTQLAVLSPEKQLHLYELFNPVHRLIDFWCVQPGQCQPHAPLSQWQPADWQSATVHLHPLLKTDSVRQDLLTCAAQSRFFDFARHLSYPAPAPVALSSTQAAALLPLWEAPQPFSALIESYLKFHPIQFPSLEPNNGAIATQQLIPILTRLEDYLYILVEP